MPIEDAGWTHSVSIFTASLLGFCTSSCELSTWRGKGPHLSLPSLPCSPPLSLLPACLPSYFPSILTSVLDYVRMEVCVPACILLLSSFPSFRTDMDRLGEFYTPASLSPNLPGRHCVLHGRSEKIQIKAVQWPGSPPANTAHGDLVPVHLPLKHFSTHSPLNSRVHRHHSGALLKADFDPADLWRGLQFPRGLPRLLAANCTGHANPRTAALLTLSSQLILLCGLSSWFFLSSWSCVQLINCTAD